MAGCYIPWVKGLTRRREVLMMAAQLGISRREVAAACCEIWEWCDDECVTDSSRNCHIKGVTRNALNVLSDVTGLMDAMLSVGWIVPGEEPDSWIFPKLGSWVGTIAKERLSNADRQRKHREKRNGDRDNSNAKVVTKALPEKRREEKNITPPPSIPPVATSTGADASGGGCGGDDSEVWRQAVEIAKTVCDTIQRHPADSGQYQRLVVQAAFLSITALDATWLEEATEATAKAKKNWAYFRGCLDRGAEDRGHKLGKLLAATRVPAFAMPKPRKVSA